MDFVKRDFQYCWRSTLNRDNFDDNMYFEDPISKFTNYTGALLLLRFMTMPAPFSSKACLLSQMTADKCMGCCRLQIQHRLSEKLSGSHL